ncbi:MAG TPA: alkyl sulfatase dimerization domain-containing protein [Acidimicrobiales bacterium]|nr:alkyl sulfatase dimerization domain-containing protein [Acidimicrobiales bacterium]
MADLLDLSSRIIDSGIADQPVNRVTQELSEVAEDLAVVESFSHSVALRSPEGAVVFDCSGAATGAEVAAAVLGWAATPVHTVVYTHGHVDHVGGSGAFLAASERAGHPRPVFVAHEAVGERFRRYRLTDAWNLLINGRQFGWLRDRALRVGGPDAAHFLPRDVVEPDHTYSERTSVSVGGMRVDLRHARGETDDHTWAWIPDRRAVCAGDFLIWNFPNAGNPQKVQRYPWEWAAALREMASLRPELLLPAHGLPVAGEQRIARVLDDVAGALETLVEQVLGMMNDGASLDDIVHGVALPAETLARPYLRPLYDEPEFVVRNVWRYYGGWWDGNPARLKPPADRVVAAEVAAMAGGAAALAARAGEVADAGDLRLACQLVEWAAQAAPDDAGVHRSRAELYGRRRAEESSLMTKGIFSWAVRESQERAGDTQGRA